MMTEHAVDRAIGEIDAALSNLPLHAPVSFGMGLFTALVRRGLVCDHEPAPIGGEDREVRVTTFRDTHPAFIDVHLAEDSFALGQAAS